MPSAELSVDTYPQELRERLTYLNAQLGSGLASNVMGTIIVAALVWPYVPSASVLTWVTLVLCVTGYRWRLRRGLPDLESASVSDMSRAWSRLRAGIVASGIAWGSASVLAFPAGSALHQAAFVMVVGGMTAGAVPMLAVRFTPYAISCLTVLLPMAVRLAAEGTGTHLVLGGTTLILIVMMLRSARNFSRLFQESARLRARLERQASIDSLTGLANRREFDRVAEREWRAASRSRSCLSVLVLDADYFKAYNDHYGHVQGDDCLWQISECLRGSLHRPKDLAARIGGEEFMVLLPDCAAEGALEVAQRIRDTVRARAIPHVRSPITDKVTLSIGTASTVPSPDTHLRQLIERADRALYKAKGSGRDRACAWGTVALAPTPSETTSTPG
ncbi:MAG: diguanylate cyclase [Pseudomonadota bacterium]